MIERKPIESKPIPEFGPIRFRIVTGLFLLSLAINAFVIFSVVDGSQIVREVEAQVGHPLGCYEAYSQRKINNYFYPERHTQGEAIYIFSIFYPFWLLACSIVSIALSILWKTGKLYRWLPVIITGGIVVYIARVTPMLNILACALD